MKIEFQPIGVVRSEIRDKKSAPRHYSVSDIEGVIEIFPEYSDGLFRIEERSHIFVLFYFHESARDYESRQTPPTGDGPKGVFSTCSPNRPNPIGLSILQLLRVEGNKLYVKNVDMIDGTPVLDIKPYKL